MKKAVRLYSRSSRGERNEANCSDAGRSKQELKERRGEGTDDVAEIGEGHRARSGRVQESLRELARSQEVVGERCWRKLLEEEVSENEGMGLGKKRTGSEVYSCSIYRCPRLVLRYQRVSGRD